MWRTVSDTSGYLTCDVSCELTALFECFEVASRKRPQFIPAKGVLFVCVVSFRRVLLYTHPSHRVDPSLLASTAHGASSWGCTGVSLGVGLSGPFTGTPVARPVGCWLLGTPSGGCGGTRRFSAARLFRSGARTPRAKWHGCPLVRPGPDRGRRFLTPLGLWGRWACGGREHPTAPSFLICDA